MNPFNISKRAIAAFFLLAPLVAVGAETSPENVVRAAIVDLMGTMENGGAALTEDPRRLRSMVARAIKGRVDLRLTSRWVLGKYWRRASSDQKDRFVRGFNDLLIRTYSAAVTEFADAKVKFLPTRFKNGRKATVSTRVQRGGTGKPIAVDYKLSRKGSDWMVYDVSIEGISLITTYRASFSNLARKHGLDHLIDTLETKNRESAGA